MTSTLATPESALMKPDRRFLLAHPAHFIALGGGAGLSKRAPGTAGTLAALPLYWAAVVLGGSIAVATLGVVLFMIGIWASARTGRALGVADHGSIVVDEVAAFLLVLAYVSHTSSPASLWVLVAFLLFRLFDIAKPWPISVADKHVKGGFGVMFDDLLAALATIGCIVVVQSLMT